jgi:hypothetical protein
MIAIKAIGRRAFMAGLAAVATLRPAMTNDDDIVHIDRPENSDRPFPLFRWVALYHDDFGELPVGLWDYGSMVALKPGDTFTLSFENGDLPHLGKVTFQVPDGSDYGELRGEWDYKTVTSVEKRRGPFKVVLLANRPNV